LFLGNQQKLLPPELHFLTPICIKSFFGTGGDPLALFRGPTTIGVAGEEGEERQRRGDERGPLP